MTEKFFKAVKFATKAHHSQRRKASTDPYIVHPIRVAYLAKDAGLSDNAVIAAVLHDVVEDTDVGIVEIDMEFGSEVSNIVHRLSKWWGDSDEKSKKEAFKPVYYKKILECPEAVNVKLLDRIDNLRDMMLILPTQTRWAVRYLKKTEDEVTPILLASNNPAIQELYRGTLALFKAKLMHYGIKYD